MTLAVTVAHADDQSIIAKFKTTWRAQDGETLDQILSRVKTVARFVPRGWEVDKTADGQQEITFSWARHNSDKSGDNYTMFFDSAADGSIALDPPYAKPIELGWQPFAISLIASEVADEEPNPNVKFLHDLSNFNFVATDKGKLGDLLKSGRCSITNDPVNVVYAPKLDDKEPGDYWHLQMQVDCDIPGPKYFTKGGVVLFDKTANGGWRPASFFARRIAANDPGHWFDHADAQERATYDAAHEELERLGSPLGQAPSPFK